MGLKFEWSHQKARGNLKKHHVSFEEASTVFRDPLSVTVSDPVHSEPGDERLVILGHSNRGRLLVVVHSEEEERIRIISARRPTLRERNQYEQG